MKIETLKSKFNHLVGNKPHEAAAAVGSNVSSQKVKQELEVASKPIQEVLRVLQSEKQLTTTNILGSVQELTRVFQAAHQEGRLDTTEYVVVGFNTPTGKTEFLGTLQYFVSMNSAQQITDFGVQVEVSTVPLSILNELQTSNRDVYAAVATGVGSSLQAAPQHRSILGADCHDTAMAATHNSAETNLGDAHTFNLLAVALGAQQPGTVMDTLLATTAQHVCGTAATLQIGQAAHVHHLEKTAQSHQVKAVGQTGIYGGLETSTIRVTAQKFNQIKQQLSQVSITYFPGIFSKRVELPNPAGTLGNAALAGLALSGDVTKLATLQQVIFNPQNVNAPIRELV